ncbi:MAG: endolytic transglycosylase MltG [Rhizobiaceae bacterium]
MARYRACLKEFDPLSDETRKSVFGRNAQNGGVQPQVDLGEPMAQDNVVQLDPIVPRSPREAIEPQDIIPPVRRSDRARGGMVRFFNSLMTMALFGAIFFVGVIWYGKTEFDAPGPLAAETTFTVPKGATFSSIVPGLESKSIIKKQGPLRVFTRGVRAAGQASGLKAGEFAFTPGMSMRAVMEQLTEGRAIQYSITFPEGWTSFRIMERIAANEELEGDVPAIPPEGTLLPNTYNFQRGDSRESIVSKLQEGQKKALRDIWHSRAPDLPLRSQEELVILASIIERETGVASERRHVSSVFINRLRKGMRLQTDPTVIYGLWGGRGKPKDRGGLRRSELDKKTPYNTYQINGLPPGPIANPGIESLRAAANPLDTDDLFFVADGTGGHVFAKTLKEHNSNVANWRAVERRRIKEAEAKAKELADGVTKPATQDN